MTLKWPLERSCALTCENLPDMESSTENLEDCDTVSETLLDYYRKFGKDRRLKKFLRLKQSGSKAECLLSASSSDSKAVIPENNLSCAGNEGQNADIAESFERLESNCSLSATEGRLTDSSTDLDDEIKAQGNGERKQRIEKDKRLLEWDSLGDIGYTKELTQTKQGSAKLKRPTTSKSIISRRDNELDNLTISSVKLTESPKESWRHTLETIKNKYCHQEQHLKNSKISGASTPKTIITKESKSVQVSPVNVTCKEIQVSMSNYSLKDQSAAESESSATQRSTESEKKAMKSSKRGNYVKTTSTLDSGASASSTTLLNETNSVDVDMGINLLCCLIESKNLSYRRKKHLAEKIFAKIIKTDKQKKNVSSKSENSMSTTASDIVMQKDISPQNIPEQAFNRLRTVHLADTEDTSNTGASSMSSENVHREKKKDALNELEAEHSTKYADYIKACLDPMTRSEVNYEKGAKTVLLSKSNTLSFVPTSNIFISGERKNNIDATNGHLTSSSTCQPRELVNFVANEQKLHLNWIENEIEHLQNLMQLLSSTKGIMSKPDEEKRLYTSTEGHLSRNIYDNVANNSSLEDSTSVAGCSSNPYRVTKIISEKEILNAKNQHIRSEIRREDKMLYDKPLGKPIDTQTDKNIKKRKAVEIQDEKRFPKRDYMLDSIKNMRSKLETPTTCLPGNVADFARSRRRQFLEKCVKTYSPKDNSENSVENVHYSEPCEKSKPKTSNSGSNTTKSSSSFFVSSESISIPESGSSPTTTTHQYDNRTGVGVQTTDSVLLTGNIFGKQTVPTIRSYARGRNKQVQANPESLAYVINFGNSCSPVELTLREHLEKQRPDFTESTQKRCSILTERRSLRQQRNEQIREIVENTSLRSIPAKFKELPPPPAKQTRIFASQEMKRMSKQKYSQLPEVIERKNNLKNEKRKVTNRIILHVFNERVQQRVRKGKINLEHSITMI